MHEAIGHLVAAVNLYHVDHHSNVAIDTLLAAVAFIVFVLLVAGAAEATRLKDKRRQASGDSEA